MKPPPVDRPLIDLTMPIADHFRWPVERRLVADHARGDLFQVTWQGFAVHGFTHIDSPRHYFPDGKTTDDIGLEATVGPAAVIDLSPIAPMTAIDAARLETAGGHVRADEIILFRTGWCEQRSATAPEFWLDAPFLERSAAEWLLARSPRAVAFDFPQDYCIRLLLAGEARPIEEHVSHDVLLRNDVVLIEYLTNTLAITTSRVHFCCLPLKLPASDGAPARVVAWLA
ncbi:MAG: cyclase family protein [Pseudomonadota bacterium]